MSRISRSPLAAVALMTCASLLALSTGCGKSPTDPAGGRPVPQSPPRPSTPVTMVAGNVYAERENHCPPDAVVDVLDGPRAGLRVVQDYATCVTEGNGWLSFIISDLPPSTPVTLRASAPGYVPQERTVFPDGIPVRFVLRGP